MSDEILLSTSSTCTESQTNDVVNRNGYDSGVSYSSRSFDGDDDDSSSSSSSNSSNDSGGNDNNNDNDDNFSYQEFHDDDQLITDVEEGNDANDDVEEHTHVFEADISIESPGKKMERKNDDNNSLGSEIFFSSEGMAEIQPVEINNDENSNSEDTGNDDDDDDDNEEHSKNVKDIFHTKPIVSLGASSLIGLFQKSPSGEQLTREDENDDVESNNNTSCYNGTKSYINERGSGSESEEQSFNISRRSMFQRQITDKAVNGTARDDGDDDVESNNNISDYNGRKIYISESGSEEGSFSHIHKSFLHRQVTERAFNGKKSQTCYDSEYINDILSKTPKRSNHTWIEDIGPIKDKSINNNESDLLLPRDVSYGTYQTSTNVGNTERQSLLSDFFQQQGIESEGFNAQKTIDNRENISTKPSFCTLLRSTCSIGSIMNAVTGSVIYGLFHIVFCLAQASAITRPHSTPILGPMVRMAALGPILSAPIFLLNMGKSFSDMYPSIDTFLAPFYVQQALIIDRVLFENGLSDHDDMFLTTFATVTCIGLCLTGVLLILATKFKMCNLGAYLPFPVMAGFFSTIGVLLWTLAFSVDTGKNFVHLLEGKEGGWLKVKPLLFQHSFSALTGVMMKLAGGWRGSLMPFMTMMTIPVAYLTLFVTGTTLEDARRSGWFWYDRDFNTTEETSNRTLPFGSIVGIIEGKVYWQAVWEAMPITLALALIYFIRCSLHAPALKKTADGILKIREEQESKELKKSLRSYSVRDNGDYYDYEEDDDDDDEYNQSKISSKPQPMSMSQVYTYYGMILSFSGLAGGSAALPSLGPSSTMTMLGSTGFSPQYGSVIILLLFYLTNFNLVGYIPKVTFSSLLVVASMNMIEDWFFKSYSKIKEKGEWAVIPVIVVIAFVLGVLPSVFLGIAISTFIFVAAFQRSGVLKFIANGLTVHSTTERGVVDAEWLDEHGDLIQILVLQNYLFFGNAYSCYTVVELMFEDPPGVDIDALDFPLPPLPKYIVIDMTMTTGIDASAVDVFKDIVSLCYDKGCKVFISGLKSELKRSFMCGTVKPSMDKKSIFSALRWLPDMEAALARAEDKLLKYEYKQEAKENEREKRHTLRRSMSTFDEGFFSALKQIDI